MIGKGRLLTYTGKLVDKKYFYQKEKNIYIIKYRSLLGYMVLKGLEGGMYCREKARC